MNMNIKKAMSKIKNFFCKIRKNISRKFNLTFSLRKKNEDVDPLLSVNVKGEIPREVVAFFAIFGALTFLFGLIKLIRKLS